MLFEDVRPVSNVAMNILRKRYFLPEETEWNQNANRVVDYVVPDSFPEKETIRKIIQNRYFLPNSPCIANAGKKNGGLIACFVVPMDDSIESIYKTKLDFALVAKKGGGCGTVLSNIRPKNAKVNGSAHGYSGGGIDFFNTICHDMEVMTQSGFRQMAMMGTCSVYYPDILAFINAKEQEGKMSTTNISVVVDDEFMRKVEKDEPYTTYFEYQDGTKIYGETYNARDIFNMIVEGAWRNGEPGLIFYDRINDSPYKYAGVKIEATNPCGEQPLPPYGSCNLGSIDLSKFYNKEKDDLDYDKLEKVVRLANRFLDFVIDKNSFPSKDFENVAKKSRPVGIGTMGMADLFLMKKLAYGSKESAEYMEKILSFIMETAYNESEIMGKEIGIPEWCKTLPTPRRNITCITQAPTGTISLIAGCNSGIEPIFSEITIRNDKTGTYQFEHDLSSKEYFRCAVSANGAKEVTWDEHILIQSVAQKFSDSGVSKTINFPSHTHRETIKKAFIEAWKTNCKGITVYRNGSRNVEVLSPKNLKKDKCPVCEADIIKYDGCKKCSKCDWSMCEVG